MTTSEAAGREPLKHLLVPTDFSKGAERVIGRALQLPLAPGARVHVVHVLPGDLPAKVRAKAEADTRNSLEQTLSRAAGHVRQSSGALKLTSEVLRGEAFVEIIRCSRIDAELIVLGRHGRRPVRDMFIGTTAERVIRKGDVPVLVATINPSEPYRRPLIATDLEDASRRTFELALLVLGPEAKSVSVVHAYPAPFEGFITPTVSAREKSDYRRSFHEQAVKGLASPGALPRHRRAVEGGRPVRRCAIGRSRRGPAAAGGPPGRWYARPFGRCTRPSRERRRVGD